MSARVSSSTRPVRRYGGPLPYGRRMNALAGCVQLYRPLGYLATFGYLDHVAGPLRQDEAAMLRLHPGLSAEEAGSDQLCRRRCHPPRIVRPGGPRERRSHTPGRAERPPETA